MRNLVIRLPLFLIVITCFFLAPATGSAADVIEFLSGSKVTGTVTRIDKGAKRVTFTATIGSRKVTRTYDYSRIHAITYRGKRFVLTPKGAAGAKPSTGAGKGSTGNTPAGSVKSKAAIDAIIEQSGRTPPDWFENTPLDYPKTLNLQWPERAPKGWNNQRNVGQYIWDVVNPNPGRWRSGVKLLHHLVSLHKDDPATLQRVMRALGAMYFRFFQDYARAAFWLKRSSNGAPAGIKMQIAECYFRLGSKQAALAILDRRHLTSGAIKLLGDTGETRQAVAYANTYVKAGGQPQIAYLLAGDACRLAGDHAMAVTYYQKSIDAPGSGKKGKIDQTKNRARASMAAIRLFDRSDVKRVPDGVYRASSLGYEGQVEVEVTVDSHRIRNVRVTKHREKQFYSSLTDVPANIIKKQSVKGVESTSRATITGEAIINATAKALAAQAQ